MLRPTRALALATIPLAATLSACTSSDSASATEVVSTQSECKAEKTSFDAGKLTLRLKNEGKQPTELYVYGKGDRIIGEVENVGPGSARNLVVNVKAGSYELACKPGQKGSGIRVPIEVTGDGGGEDAASAEAPTKYDREIELDAVDYAFEKPITGITAGQVIEFKLHNKGTKDHEFELFGPDGHVIGEIPPVKPGEEGEAILELKKAGVYRYVCGVDDHETRGMTGTFEVT